MTLYGGVLLFSIVVFVIALPGNLKRWRSRRARWAAGREVERTVRSWRK